MENHQSPCGDSSPMQEQSSLQPSKTDDQPEYESNSDAVLISLLNASIQRMDQESETITGSSSTHNYESGGNMESFPSSDRENYSTEAESVAENNMQHEQNTVPNKRPRTITWKSNSTDSRGVFIGEIRHIGDGNIEWKDGNEWVPAVYHNSIREKLINQAEQLGSYDHPRKHGLDPLDITSFHPDQKTWGPDRNEHWPFMPDQLLFRLERQGYPAPDYHVTRWIDDGRIVLDMDNRPIRNFHSIPLTLSSEMEGYLMEMINRMDTRISHRDLRARMPHTVQTGTGTKSIMSMNGIDVRLKRFRLENACPSWYEKNSSPLKSFVMKVLSEEGLKSNSTQELSGLTKLQQEIVTKGIKHESSSSPSTRKSDPVSRAPRSQAAKIYKFEKLLRGQKRKRKDDSLLVSDDKSPTSNPRPTKVTRSDSEGRGRLIIEQAKQASSSWITNFKDLISTNAARNHSSLDDSSQYTSSSALPTPPVYYFEELDITVADYKRWLGYHPPPTNPEDDPEIQYNDLQRDFNAQWKGDGPAPQLLCSRACNPTVESETTNQDFSEI